ncbi:MAG: DUF1549 domain-containing protein, partial [Acidobacteriota bacterium]
MILALAAVLFLPFVGLAAAAPADSLAGYPPAIRLSSAESRQQIVVQVVRANGVTEDVTAQCKWGVPDSKIAHLEGSTVSAVSDGRMDVQLSYGGITSSIPIVVTNASLRRSTSFKLDVMPVFTRAGCNAGSCHGTSRGKDGFHLSLYGFDPDGDYQRLTREQIGRRVNLAIPEESLIVQKGLGAVQHTGGVRFGTNSDLCQTLIHWLAAGATNDPPSTPRVTGIDIFPKTAVLEGSNALQQFIVQAHYSDGTERDVTSTAVFPSNNDVSAKVSEDGLVTAGQRGEAFIQARFGEFNVGAQLIVLPHGLPYAWPDIKAYNYVDEAVFAKLKKLRVTPSDVCDDTAFVRRVFLDITGTLPRAEDLAAFSADKDPARREHLVDKLIGQKEFAEMWVMKLAELLQIRSRDNQVYPKAALLYFEWLRDQIVTNVPLDRIVQGLLTSTGSTLHEPAANYFQMEPDTLKLAENTAQVFMGMRIQCAQCHNHPFDRWTMKDYYGFAAFFAQVGRKPGEDPRETVLFDRHDGEVKLPTTGAVLPPKFLGGDTPAIKSESRRQVLAKWLTSPANPYFA